MKLTNEKLLEELQDIVKPIKEEQDKIREAIQTLQEREIQPAEGHIAVWYQPKLPPEQDKEFAEALKDLMEKYHIGRIDKAGWIKQFK